MGYQLSDMIAKKRHPGLSGFLSFGINGDTVRSEIENPSFSNSPRMRGSPDWIGGYHGSNQLLDLQTHSRAS